MELQIDIDTRVREWLASMGYPVAGMPAELLQGMLLREARQWQLSPEALCALIDEGSDAAAELTTSGALRDARTRRVPAFRPVEMLT